MKATSYWVCLVTSLVIVPVAAQNFWPKATPSAVGLDAKVLDAFDADIASGKYGNVDGMLVIRHGKVA